MSKQGVNKVILVGNCGQDPETRYMPNGKAVTNLTLATSESWKDKNTGQQVDKTEWHRVTFYDRLAEIVAEYVKKGSKLYVEGKLQTRSWDKDGTKHYATEVIANEMQMLDSRQGNSRAPSQAPRPDNNFQQPPQASQVPQQQAPSNLNDFDDDIPFR